VASDPLNEALARAVANARHGRPDRVSKTDRKIVAEAVRRGHPKREYITYAEEDKP
jgi:hypothetical protein